MQARSTVKSVQSIPGWYSDRTTQRLNTMSILDRLGSTIQIQRLWHLHEMPWRMQLHESVHWNDRIPSNDFWVWTFKYERNHPSLAHPWLLPSLSRCHFNWKRIYFIIIAHCLNFKKFMKDRVDQTAVESMWPKYVFVLYCQPHQALQDQNHSANWSQISIYIYTL